jgi:tetratricopeptide (TPR) repeat protein
MQSALSILLLSFMLLAQPAGQTQEATSLFGKPLISTPPTGETKVRLEADLVKAQAEYDRNPSSADAAIWLGRRLAYLGRFNDAIAAYTRGIQQHPDEARLYRHRGHRYITIRKFDLATADLRRASQLVAGKPDEVEPDGAPNGPAFRAARCSRTSGITLASHSTCPATSTRRWRAIAKA